MNPIAGKTILAKLEKPPKMAEETKKQDEKQETALEFTASMAGVLVTGLFILTFAIQAFEIPSSSMEKTLLIGDHVFVDRVSYAPRTRWFPVMPYREIRHGDIVVFLSPAEPGLFLVKRVIGLPGDRIHLRDSVVYRNGEPLTEPYVVHCARDNTCDSPTPEYYPFRDNFPAVPPSEGTVTPEWHLTMNAHIENGDIVVPPGSYFGMGDNRDVSYDSRYWGFIPRENVIGRPLFVYWSFETPPHQYEKTAISQRLAFIGKVIIHFFDQTRWRRMLKVVH